MVQKMQTAEVARLNDVPVVSLPFNLGIGEEKFDIFIGSPARLMSRTMLKAKTHPTGKHEKELAK